MACGKTCCCYYFPICGGFFAPTENPDESFWRHFSNEITVPGSARYMQLAPYVENSACCTNIAKLGLPAAERHRKKIMATAACANIIALILTIVALLGVTMNPSILERTHWVHGSGSGGSLEVYIGVQMMSERVDCAKATESGMVATASLCGERLKQVGFVQQPSSVYMKNTQWKGEDVCGHEYMAGPERDKMKALCQQCKKSMLPVTSLIVSILTQFPTLTTDLQRATVFGDVNCQATMGVVSNLVSLVTSMVSLLGFRFACFTEMPDSINGRQVQWELGIGFRCLMFATLIKVFDAACHVVLPTPRARWTKPSPEIQDVKDYMMLACEGINLKYDHDDTQPVGKAQVATSATE